MAVVWIVTTGNSDVVMSSKDDWEDLRGQKKLRQVYDQFKVSPLPKNNNDEETLFALPARALGTFYEDALEDDEYWETLRFPLLKGFVARLKDEPKQPTNIIVLLTDQKNIFNERKVSSSSPFWQDTCKLEPIFRKYFSEQKDIQAADLDFIYLIPKSDHQRGLDDWNYVLELVQDELIKKIEEVGVNNTEDSIIVSHQAGTPAISSAVQLTTLIRYGSKVQFLVSSELDSNPPEFVDGSNYFKAIQTKKLSDLLERYDYSGMTSIVNDMNFGSTQVKSKLLHLLKQANFWNTVEFEKFAMAMGESASSRSQEWWWSAYESAYLAVVRLKQENTVEAMFHSFRAVEGLLSMWLDKFHIAKKEGKTIKLSSDFTLPSGKKTKSLHAYGQGLYFALEHFEGVDANSDIDIWTFGNKVFDKRNDIFHKLEGLQDKNSVFSAWEVTSDSEEDWKTRVLNCLNFISKEKFKSIEEASLMARVHKELVEEIGAIANVPNN